MNIQHKISLKSYNTFHIDHKAKTFVELENIGESLKFISSQDFKKNDYYILGGGSNVLLTKDFEGIIVHPNFKGIDVLEETNESVLIKVGAGEIWEDFVKYTVSKNWYGIENLALVPGRVGAAPIQNIGAYGVELKDVFHSLNAIDIKYQKVKSFSKEDCKFGYRHSYFKKHLGKYLICDVTIKLSKIHHLNLSYHALKDCFKDIRKNEITQKMVFDAVVEIRRSKLPDPKDLGNSGSFFKNPLVTNSKLESLKRKYPDIKSFAVDEKHSKFAAAWLIEKAGLKGYRKGNAGVHILQSLVIVNYGDASGKEIYELSELVKNKVFECFCVRLEREVNIL